MKFARLVYTISSICFAGKAGSWQQTSPRCAKYLQNVWKSRWIVLKLILICSLLYITQVYKSYSNKWTVYKYLHSCYQTCKFLGKMSQQSLLKVECSWRVFTRENSVISLANDNKSSMLFVIECKIYRKHLCSVVNSSNKSCKINICRYPYNNTTIQIILLTTLFICI